MCPNKTEVGHMAAAVYFWKTLRFDVFHVNPPMTRIVSGLPIILCDPKYNWDCYSPRPQDRSEWALGRAFLNANSHVKNRRCCVLARWSLIPFLLLGGYFGWRLCHEIYGDSAGIIFLVMWCFSPLILAWGATICPDAVAASLGIVAIYAFYRWLHKPGWMQTGIAGVCLGLLPLTKLTWTTAFGIWPMMWLFWIVPVYLESAEKRPGPHPSFLRLAAVLAVGLYTLNTGYLFDGTFRPLGKYVFTSQLFRGKEVPEKQKTSVTKNRFVETWLGATPVPLPAEFVQGIDTQRLDFERGLPSYLRGEWADHGWWYYYLYALAIKEPLGTWCLAALAVVVTILDRGYSASWRDEMIVLLPFGVILVFVSSQTGFSVHSRYIIPALPFLYVWTSKVARVFEVRPFTRQRLVMATMVVLMLVWLMGSSLAVYPHSLSYFNELATVLPTPADASYPKPTGRRDENHSILSLITDMIGTDPRNGPRHLLDSNVDWGQDLFYLEDWCESHPEAHPIKVAYFGSYPLDRSQIESAGRPPIGLEKGQLDGQTDEATLGPVPGWYALSVNEVFGRSQQYRYFLHFRPVAMAGYSICIYHITVEEANRVRGEMGLRKVIDVMSVGGYMNEK
jgi:hypothetical protein